MDLRLLLPKMPESLEIDIKKINVELKNILSFIMMKIY